MNAQLPANELQNPSPKSAKSGRSGQSSASIADRWRESAARAHLAEALRWSSEGPGDLAMIASAGLGLAGPIVLGAAVHRLDLGMAASLGGMMLSRVETGRTFGRQMVNLVAVLAPAACAVAMGLLLSRLGIGGNFLLAMLIGIAALAGGFSRPTAAIAARFATFLLISANVGAANSHPLGLLLVLIGLGAVWTVTLGLVFGALARALGRRRDGPAVLPVTTPIPAPSWSQRFKRWRTSLTRFEGWQYPLRITACLMVAALLVMVWRGHHAYWIALTAAIVSQRKLSGWPVKTTQRAGGTALGVVLGSAMLAWPLPTWIIVALIGSIAAARPFLRARNYLAYSVVQTPLIILLMSLGQRPTLAVLSDRLLATLIGAALAIIANELFRWLAPSPPAQTRSSVGGSSGEREVVPVA